MTPEELVETALQWLNMFDKGNFGECWEYASPVLNLKTSVEREKDM